MTGGSSLYPAKATDRHHHCPPLSVLGFLYLPCQVYQLHITVRLVLPTIMSAVRENRSGDLIII